ncbi:hypothetical protein F2P81_009817 [Scophthalmus maximus]|uniref:Uncharacterized protein n=1 Tax=Scophthalmus maximus TaxID=52904 RepID=A0A6A4SSH3_SCOMX|nr:hypothetical protein F2P81_009817 [Scophthalmus maximus]
MLQVKHPEKLQTDDRQIPSSEIRRLQLHRRRKRASATSDELQAVERRRDPAESRGNSRSHRRKTVQTVKRSLDVNGISGITDSATRTEPTRPLPVMDVQNKIPR